MKIRLKKQVEVPAYIQAFIDGVLAAESLADALDGFAWVYDKGDFTQWVALFNHFDDLLDKHIKEHRELQLKFEGSDSGTPATAFPVADCLAILRVTSILLENTTNKHLYQSYDLLAHLLASPHPEVVSAALQTLVSFLKKTHHASIRWHGYREVNSRLMALCQGWGGKEEGLELVTCVRDDEAQVQRGLSKVTTLHYEFFKEDPHHRPDTSRPIVIHVPALHKLPDGEYDILRQLVLRYDVPEQHRFPLLAKIRVARAFATVEGRRQLVRIRLMAFCILMQSNLPTEEAQLLLQVEPEMVGDLVALVQAEQGVPQDLRALAVRTLAVQMPDRNRGAAIVAAVSSRTHGGVLSMLLHKAVTSMVEQSQQRKGQGTDGSASTSAGAGASALAAPSSSQGALGSAAEAGPVVAAGGPSVVYTVDFVDSMLLLISALVQTSVGCSALADAGVVAALLPLLQDDDPAHLGIVATTVKITETFMDFHQNANTMFRDLNGLHEMIVRLAKEVGVSPEALEQEMVEAAAAAEAGAGSGGAERMATDDDPAASAAAGAPSSPAAAAPMPVAAPAAAAPATLSKAQLAAAAVAPLPPVAVPYQRKVLMKFLLRAIAMSSYTPSSTTNTRPQEQDAALLYRCLRTMFEQSDAFGGSLFALGASVVTDLIHHDPLVYRALDASGLPQAFIKAVQAGVLPYGEAVVSLANTLVALCLNTSGLELVQKTRIMDSFIPIFTNKKYHKALGGETPAMVGAGLEELFRFVPQLRGDGMEAVVDIFRTICIIGGDEDEVEKARQQQRKRQEQQQQEQQQQQQGADSAATDAAAAVPASGTPAAAPSSNASVAAPDAASIPAAAVGSGESGATASGPTAMETDPVPPTGAEQGEGAAGQVAPQTPAESSGESAPAAAATPQDVEMAPAPGSLETPAPAVPVAAAAPAAAGGAEAGPSDGAAAAAPAAPAREPYDQGAALAELHSVEAQGYLAESINHATRMLESLLNNPESSKEFVNRGGVDLLLKLHSLPRLSYTFAFSSASHPLLAVFRGLAPIHAQLLSLKTRDVLSHQLGLALKEVQAMGPACVPQLPETCRNTYLKVVSTIAGLCSLGSSAARNATQMLQMISTGPTQVLAQMGQLQRLFMQQVAVADAWAIAKEAERQAKEKAAAAAAVGAPSAQPGGASAAAAASPSGAAASAQAASSAAAAQAEDGGEVEGDGAAELAGIDMDVVASEAAAAPARAGEAGAGADAAATAANAAPQIHAAPIKKKTPEEISHDILHHTVSMLRGFFVAVAKSIHTPARRRDDPAHPPGQPSLGTRAAALALAVLLKGSLEVDVEPAAAATAAAVAAGVTTATPGMVPALPEATPSSGATAADPGTPAGPPAPAVADGAGAAAPAAAAPTNSHLCRLSDEIMALLFDSRRRSCHLLILNFFLALGGLDSLLVRFKQATEQLWAAIDAQQQRHQQEAAAAAATAAGSADATMMDASETTAPLGGLAPGPEAAAAAAAGPGAVAPAAAAGSGSSSKDREKEPRAVADKAVLGFLQVLEQLSNSTIICTSPQAAALLVTPLPAGAGPAATAQIRDPLELVRYLLSRVMTTVLEVWAHPSLPLAGPGLTAGLVTVLSHCAQGVSPTATNLLKANQTRTDGRATGFVPDPGVVRNIVEMGFPQPRVEEALRRIAVNSIEAAMEWLITHPEEPTAATPAAAPAVVDEDEELSRALVVGLAAIGSAPSAARQQDATSSTPAEGAAEGPVPMAEDKGKAAAAPPKPTAPAVPGTTHLVESAVSIVVRMPSGIFSMADLLLTLSTKEDAKDRNLVLSALMDRIRLPIEGGAQPSAGPSSSSAPAPAPPAASGRPEDELFVALRLLLLLLTHDTPAREAACGLGLTTKLLDLLEGWLAKYEQVAGSLPHPVAAPAVNAGGAAAVGDEQDPDPEVRRALIIPVWVEVALLTLTCLCNTAPKPPPTTSATSHPWKPMFMRMLSDMEGVDRDMMEAAVEAVQGMADGPAAPAGTGAAAEPPSGPTTATPAAPTSEAATGAGASTPGPVPPAAAAPTGAAAAAEGGAAGAGADGALAAALQGAVASAKASWHPTGLLSEEQAQRVLVACTQLLKALHAHAGRWSSPLLAQLKAPDAPLPSAAAVTQATLALLTRVTRRYAAAAQLQAAGCVRLLLTLPRACLMPNFARVEPSIIAILRNVLEDASTLEAWMEAEVRAFFAQKARARSASASSRGGAGAGGATAVAVPVGTLLSGMSRVMAREPGVFLDVVGKLCYLDAASGDSAVRLRTQPPPAAAAQPQGGAAGAAGAGAATAAAGAHAGDATSNAVAATPAPGGAASAAARDGRPAEAGAEPGVRGSSPTGPRNGSPGNPAKPSGGVGAGHKKVVVPANFTDVISSLVEVVMSWGKGPQPAPQQQQQGTEPAAAGPSDMELDASSAPRSGDAAAPAAAAAPGSSGAAAAQTATATAASGAAGPAADKALASQLAPLSQAALSQVMALRALSEFCLIHGATAGLLLKRDLELWAKEHGKPAAAGSQAAAPGASGAASAAAGGQTPGAAGVAGTPASGVTHGKRGGAGGASAAKGAGAAASSSRTPHHDKEKHQDRDKHAAGGAAGGGAQAAAGAGASAKDGAGMSAGTGDASASHHHAGSLLKQLLHVQLLTSDTALMPSMAERTAQLLQAICVRSSEGRKRIINEVVATLLLGSGTAAASPATTTTPTTTTTTHVHPASAGATPGAAPGSATGPGAGAGGQGLAAPSLAIEFSAEEKALALAPVECSVGVSAAGAFMQRPGCPHPIKVRVFVSLLATLAQPVPLAPMADPRNVAQGSAMALAADMVRTMRELGAAKALAATLRLIKPEHPGCGLAVAAVLKPLEVLTRNMSNWAATSKGQVGGQQGAGAAAATGADAGGVAAGADAGQAGTAGGAAGAGAEAGGGVAGPGEVGAGGGVAGGDAGAGAGGGGEGGARGRRRHRGPTSMHQLLQQIDMAMERLDHEGEDMDMLEGMESDEEGGDDDDGGEGDLDEEDEGEGEDDEGEEDEDEDALMEGMEEGDEEDLMHGDVDDDDDGGAAMELQLPGGGVLHVMPGDGGSSAGEDDDMSHSDGHLGGEGEGEEEGEEEDQGDVGDIQSSGEDDDGEDEEEDEELSGEEEEDEHLHVGGVDNGAGVDGVEHEHLDGEAVDDDDADMMPDLVDDYEMIGGMRMRVEETRDDDMDDDEGDEVEEAGSQYEQAGDGNEDGFVIDEDMMYGRGEGQGRMGDGGGGQFAHYVDNMGMPISVRMLADESGLTDMRMPALVQLLGEALGGAARRGGGRAGAISSRLPRLTAAGGLLGGAASDQAALLALASSNLVPQQHRMLDRPSAPGGTGGAGATAGGGGGGAAVPGLMLRTRADGGADLGATELVMLSAGGERMSMEALMASLTGTARAASQLLGGAGGAGATGSLTDALRALLGDTMRLPGPPDAFTSIFAPPSAGGLGAGSLLAQYRGVGMGPGASGGGGGGSFLPPASNGAGLFQRLLAGAMRDGSRGGAAQDAQAASATTASGEDILFDARHMEAHLLGVLRSMQPPAPPPQPPAAPAAAPPAAAGAAAGGTASAGMETAEATAPTTEPPAEPVVATPAPSAPAAAQARPDAQAAAAPAAGAAPPSVAATPAPAAPPSAPPPAPIRATGAAQGDVPDLAEGLAAVLQAALQAIAERPTPAATPTAAAVASTPAPSIAAPGTAAAGAVAPSAVPPRAAGQAEREAQQALAPAAPATAAAAPPSQASAEAGAEAAGASEPMDTDDGPAPQQQQQPAPEPSDAAMATEPALPQQQPQQQAAGAAPVAAAAGTGLDESLASAAAAAGIDLAFLEALPDELRAEVLAMHGYVPAPAPPAPVPVAAPAAAAAAVPEPVPAAGEQPAAAGEAAVPAPEGPAGPEQAAGAAATAPGGAAAGGAPAGAAAAPAAGGAAEEDEDDGMEGLDPEFLAALPPDIQEELLQQQAAERRRRQMQRRRDAAAAAAGSEAAAGAGAAGAGAGAAAEMDLASLLATFPPDVREEVLLTSEESLLRTLPPNLLAEAHALRNRFRNAMRAHHADDAAAAAGAQAAAAAAPGAAAAAPAGGASAGIAPLRLPTGMMPVQRRQGLFVARPTGARGVRGAAPGAVVGAAGAHPGPLVGPAAEDAAAARESPGLLEEQDLVTLVTLLQASSGPPKSAYQRVLFNLCGHTRTRRALLRMLLAMVRQAQAAGAAAAAADGDGADAGSGEHAMDAELEAASGSPAAAAGAGAGVGTLEQVLQQQDAHQAAAAAAAPSTTNGASETATPSGQAAASEVAGAAGLVGGVSSSSLAMATAPQPQAEVASASVQRRVLDMVTYLARHSTSVARMLITLRVPPSLGELAVPDSTPAPVDPKGKAPLGAPPLPPSVLPIALEVLLGALSLPMCQRSAGIMDLLLQLLESVLRVAVLQIESLRLRATAAERSAAAEKAAEAAAQAQADVAATAAKLAQVEAAEAATRAALAEAEAGVVAAEARLAQAEATAAASAAAVEAAVAQPGQAGAGATGAAGAPQGAGAAPAAPSPMDVASTPPQTPAEAETPRAAAAAAGSAGAGPSGTAAAAAAGGSISPFSTAVANAGAAGPSTSRPQADSAAAAAAAAAGAPYLAAAAELSAVIASIPDDLVRRLTDLLGATSLSDSAYQRASNALRHLVEAAPKHLSLLLEELSSCLVRLANSAAAALQQAAAAPGGLDATGPAMASLSAQGAAILRVLHLLQQLRKPQRMVRGAGVRRGGAAAGGDAAGGPPGTAAAHLTVSQIMQGGGPQLTGLGFTFGAQPPEDEDDEEPGAGSVPPPAAAAGTTAAPGAATATAATGEAGSSGSAAGAAGAAVPEAGAGRQGSPASAAISTLVERMAPHLAPLWSGLSTCIAAIEGHMAAPGARASSSAGADARRAAAEMLPPGAAQVLPLVEAFFVVCALEDALPPEPASPPASELLPGMSTDVSALVAQVTGQAPSIGGPGAAMSGAGAAMSGAGAAASGSGAAEPPMRRLSSGAQAQAQVAAEEKCAPFTRFVERHSRLLNAYIRRSHALLEGSLAPLLRVHKLIDFDNKRMWFRAKIRQQDNNRPYGGTLRVNVRREHVFEDSFHQLRSRSPEEMRLKLSVQFTGEEGIDAGGVSREWFQVMAREMFNPNLALFIAVPEGGTTFQPNPNSVIQSDRGINHLDYFKFVGRIVGKALHDGQLIDAYFTRSFYKHMLGLALTYEDIEAVDPEYYKNLRWMLENDITDVLDLTFTAESDFFGRKELVELVPGGKDIRVTEANKREYISLITRHRMTTSIRSQIASFLEGFWQLVPRHHIAIFNDHELELLISGLPEVDIGDLRANTEYSGYTTASPVIRWFWEAVGEMSAEDQALLLQFVTGTSKVPLEGFKALQGIGGPQKFQIHKAYGQTDRLPSAHTCFNQLDLPEYENKEQLVSKLMVALRQGAQGFGFA